MEQRQGDYHPSSATIDEPPLREQFLRASLVMLPKEKPRSQEALTSSRDGGLSARERDVAALVAQDRSNREIAAILVVSERIAEAHVSNILGKLVLSQSSIAKQKEGIYCERYYDRGLRHFR